MRVDAFAHPTELVLAVEAEDGATALMAMASATGTWDIGHEAAAGTIAGLRRRVASSALPSMPDAIELLIAAHLEACEAEPDRQERDGAIDTMLARVMPGTYGVVELAWVGSCRAYLIRGGRIYAHARPHCHGETLVAEARRREEVYADREQMPFTRWRLLYPDEPPNFERLMVSWPFGPEDTLVMLNDKVWEQVDDQTIVRLARGPQPARALVQAANSPRSDTAAIVVQRV